MFALEIDFHDGISPSEMLLVRRSNVVIGNGENAHVVIEGVKSSLCDVRITRELGRQFRCQPIRKCSELANVLPLLEGVYSEEAELTLGEASIHITALDIDLMVLPEESLDQAVLRILHRTLTRPVPVFPAAVVLGSAPMFVSFTEDLSLVVGRSRKCSLRLDSSGISGEHACMGYDGNAFWIEDLGSTNGTLIGGEPIREKTVLEKEDTVVIGGEFVIAGVTCAQDVLALKERKISYPQPAISPQSYPCLLSTSALVRPSRMSILPGVVIRVGRDPASDIWVGSPHVSRCHLELCLHNDHSIEVTDLSSNGTFVEGTKLVKNTSTKLPQALTSIDLMEGVVLSVCHSLEDEQLFLDLFQRREQSQEQGPQMGKHRGYETVVHLRDSSPDIDDVSAEYEERDYAEKKQVANEPNNDGGNNFGNDSFTNFANRLKHQNAEDSQSPVFEHASDKIMSERRSTFDRQSTYSSQSAQAVAEYSRKKRFHRTIFFGSLVCLAVIILVIITAFY